MIAAFLYAIRLLDTAKIALNRLISPMAATAQNGANLK